jgi:hypothetical protein
MLTTTEDSHQLDRLGNSIKAYRLASGQSLAFSMIHVARNFASALHSETARIAPSEAKLLELPGKLGWRIKRKAGGGRRSAMEEIFRRIRHRKFLAAGWLPAVRGFVQTNTVTTLDKRLGAVLAQVEMTGEVHIMLINRCGGIEKETRERDLLRKAVNKTFREIAPYIKSHLGEEARRAFWKI